MMIYVGFAACACSALDIVWAVIEAYRVVVAAVTIAFCGAMLGISVFALAWILGRP